jgi:hypothetical protein
MAVKPANEPFWVLTEVIVGLKALVRFLDPQQLPFLCERSKNPRLVVKV